MAGAMGADGRGVTGRERQRSGCSHV